MEAYKKEQISADFMDTKMTNREVGPQLESLQTAFGHMGICDLLCKESNVEGNI